jgi:hypothetical protein
MHLINNKCIITYKTMTTKTLVYFLQHRAGLQTSIYDESIIPDMTMEMEQCMLMDAWT